MSKKETFWKNFIIQVWRFIVLNIKVLKGVDHSKRLPAFVIKYKVSYVVTGGDHPPTMINTEKPPQVGEHVHLGRGKFEVMEVHQLIPPRGEFCFLQAMCKVIGNSDIK
jgi:hypothetical protein